MSYPLSFITPSGKIFEGNVESTIAPGTQGVFEILSGHASMAITLKEGTVTLRQQARKLQFTIGPGILEVAQDHRVLLLADSAAPTQVI